MNALKLSLAGALGFVFACVLVIGSIIFTGSNVMIEKKFTVSATVDGGLVNINCSTISSIGTPFQEEAQLIGQLIGRPFQKEAQQLIVQGYGHRGNSGFVGRAIVAVYHGGQATDVSTGYHTVLKGHTSYRGQSVGNDKIAGEVTNACLGNVNMIML